MPEVNPHYEAMPTNQSASRAEQSRVGLADNFDTFLTLLTSQLKHQDPMDPLDSNEFVSQLVQFSSVEQLIASNQSLEGLLSLQAANTQLSAVEFIGRMATVSSDRAALSDGEAVWEYELPREAEEVSILITDSQGRTVHTRTGETGQGKHALVWDGKDAGGNPQPEGEYRLEVVARDADGERIDVAKRVSGQVTGIDLSQGEAIVEIGDLRVPASRVISVRQTPAVEV